MKFDSFSRFYSTHKGGMNGAFIGLAVAVSILVLNLFRTVFIALCVGIGYYLGKKMFEEKDYIKNLLDRILPPGTFR